MLRLDSEESGQLITPLTSEALLYMGSLGDSDSAPAYTSTNFINNGDSLTTSIGKLDAALLAAIPIGTVMAFDDYNGTLALPSDSYWLILDGNGGVPLVDAASPLNGQLIPDQSGRAIVGFGNLGGGNIGGLGAMAVVGVAGNTINIAHDHATDIDHGHLDDLGFSNPAHYHGYGNFDIGVGGDHSHLTYADDSGAGTGGHPSYGGNHDPSADTFTVPSPGGTNGDHGHPQADYTGYMGNIAGVDGDLDQACTKSGSVTAYTGSKTSDPKLLAAQSIQPRSVQVRFYIKFK